MAPETMCSWLGENPDVLDSVIAAETPEGILLELRPAGLSARFCAFTIDLLIRFAVFFVAIIVTSALGGLGVAFGFILYFLLDWFYPVLFELSRDGATPGKSAMGLKVVMDNGLPVTPAASMTRNLLRVADFLPFGYGAAIASMLLSRDYKRLGDLAASTIVVHQPRPAPKATLDMVKPLAPLIPLSQRDQSALIALAARAPTLTTERLEELALMATPVQGQAGGNPEDITRRVLGVSQWLLGRRS